MHYHFAINVCRLLHQSALPNESLSGKHVFLDIMDDERMMNRIFEKFLMNFYKQECRQEFPEVCRSYIRFQLTPYGMTFAKSTEKAYSLLPIMETDVTLYNPQTKKKSFSMPSTTKTHWFHDIVDRARSIAIICRR